MPNITNMLVPTLGLILVYFIVLGAAYYLGSKTAFAKAFFKTSTPPAIAAVVLFIGLYLIVVTISAQFAAEAKDTAAAAKEFAYSVAAATFGLTLGWVLGIVISPGNKDEATEFSLLTKAVSTFLTGYALAYLKDIKRADLANFLGKPEVPFRLMIGAACCLSSLAAVFVIRRAEVTVANAVREWFIRYVPAEKPHAEALAGDILARGPYSSREDAEAEIERIKGLDNFRGYTLAAARIEILTDERPAPAAAPGTPAGKPADTAMTNTTKASSGSPGTLATTADSAPKTSTDASILGVSATPGASATPPASTEAATPTGEVSLATSETSPPESQASTAGPPANETSHAGPKQDAAGAT